eukprot:Seg3724.1 transcript_id=Seg3724.1/GoldUCD/mRNA.D3Y31 product="Sarcosine dehydrogenase mitochondrial" protein_id=Seg3724.1/GoldUCD/D3Y31
MGRDILEKQKADGLKKKLVCFTIDDHKALLGLEAIWRDGKVVGFVRRAGYGYHIGKSIAFGYVTDPSGKPVKNDFIKSGNYEIESMGTKYAAKVHLKSPFDPKNERIKGNYMDLPVKL